MQYNPKIYKLRNGVTVILDPMDIETTTVKVCFRTGGRDEAPNEYGLTHFCEHMMCRGTARFPTKKSIDDFMEINGGMMNAGTGSSVLVLRGKILPENVNSLIEVFGEQIFHSSFLPEKIDTERSVIIDELRRAMDDPEEQLGYFVSHRLFGGAIPSYRTLGNVENIMSFTRDQMLDWIGRRLSAKNCIVGISGKIIDEQDLLNCLEKNLGALPSFDVFENSKIVYTPDVAHNLLPDKENVKLRIYYPDLYKQSLEKKYEQKCINYFEAFLVRKLYRVLRYENGLVYDFGGTNIGNEKQAWSGFATETSTDNIAKAMELIAKNSFEFYNNPTFTDDDLLRLRSEKRLFNADWLESANSRSRTLISFYIDFNELYDYYGFIKLGRSITPDDIVKNSRGYFNGPISIITQGAELNEDMRALWNDNFR
ncbi:MAG: insulinase family protein [Alphaproteobacteria bacterium]|nr:insulinase family protein [Alphaproteobacteria bacterium]